MEEEKKVVEVDSGLNKLVSSSENPNRLSVTIAGMIVLVAGILLPRANLGTNDVASIVDSIINIGKMVVMVAGSVVTIWGALKKTWVQIMILIGKKK